MGIADFSAGESVMAKQAFRDGTEVVGFYARTAAYVATAQYLLYAFAIASAVIRGIPANCGCFGPGDAATADWPHVAFDLVLGALCAFVAWRAPGAFALDERLNTR